MIHNYHGYVVLTIVRDPRAALSAMSGVIDLLEELISVIGLTAKPVPV
jgi:hypothetical protein